MENQLVTLKKVSIAEAELLKSISEKTFYEAFAADNAEANMRAYMQEAFKIENLANQLTNPTSEFYFALKDEVVVGYVKINRGTAQTEIQDESSLEIERIYVLKEFYGRKIGQVLYEKAIERAKESRAMYVWLGVWEKNTRAINFYKKNGFVAFDTHIFKLGDEEQTDLMMKFQLT